MGGIVDSIFGGGSSAPAQSSSTAPTSQNITTSNIAPWAQSGVQNLINAASNQIFTDPSQTQLKGYTPFNANTPAGQEWVQGAAGSVAGFSPLQQQAQQNIANMQVPGEYGTAMNAAQQAGQGYLNTTGQANGYGQVGQAAGLAGMQQGMSYGRNATDPNAVQAYMNPYLQATLNPALQLQNQQFGQLNAQNQGQATQQGAFGGGRQAVMQGLNQQNQMLAQNQLVGNAYNQAYNTANQNMQTAAQLGMQGTGQAMQGAGVGLQSVGAQQAGYGGVGSQATNLANIAGAQTTTGLGINAAQNQAGALQQQNQQNILNQAMANYNTAQTYPMTQLAQLESLYTGAPQNVTSSTYSAAPSTVSQMANLAGTGLAAAKLAGAKKGGSVEDIKKMAAGGIAKFAGRGSSLVGGAIGRTETSLENMSADQLENVIKTGTSPFMRQKAQELLAEAQPARGVTSARAGQTNFAQGGGIVAFAQGGDPGEAFSPEELEAGSNRQTPLPPVYDTSKLSGSGKKFVSNVDMMREMYGFGKPSEDEKAQREEIKQERADLKKNRNNNKWLALLEGSGEGLQSTSPFAGPGIGKLISGTAKSYAGHEKDYADQLAKLRSGELDLNKLSSSDRNNLLHYATSMAGQEQSAEDAAASKVEAAKLRNSQVGSANADRTQLKLLGIASDFYKADLKSAEDKLGINGVTEEMRQQIYTNAMRRASNVQQELASGKGKGPQVGAKDGGGAGTIRFDKDGNQIQG